MMSDQADDLRGAFSARPVTQEADDETIDAVWRAVSGEATAEELQSLLVRVRSEPAVAEAWRMAREVHSAVESPARDAAPARSKVVRGPWVASVFRRGAAGVGLGAMVAMAAAALLFVIPVEQPGGSGVLRAEQIHIDNVGVPAGVLDRASPVLRWSQLEAGTRYTVTVTTDSLVAVARVGGLDVAEWSIPASELAELPADTVLLWRVEATLPDGTKHRSATFDAVLR